MDDALLRSLIPSVIAILVRRGADFAAAEDAVQDALVEAVRVWPDDPPRDAKGWLITVAWRKFLDAARADTSRRHREARVEREPMTGPSEVVDDTLHLYFLCAHPSLTPASAVAKSAPRRTRIPITVGVRVRSRASSTGRHSVMVGSAARNGRTSSHSWTGLPPAPGAADNSPASSSARS